jgi:hypothetical protein
MEVDKSTTKIVSLDEFQENVHYDGYELYF